jgi:Na+/H+ antiporter NhaD/arsenite permease-like protein
MSHITITFAIVVAIVFLFVWNRIPVVLVALGTALALYFTGVLDLTESLGGLGDPAVIFIASLFVVSAGLDATGGTAWAGQGLIARAGQSRVRLIVLMMTLVALFTALISVNGAVAALLPVVVVMAIRLGRAPSQLLMPLVFSAHSGSLLALTGTPVNVLVSEAATDIGLPPFGFFSFAIAGIPLVVGRLRDGPAARCDGRAGLPLDQLDDGDPGRRHDPAIHRHVQEWGGEPHGGDAGTSGG